MIRLSPRYLHEAGPLDCSYPSLLLSVLYYLFIGQHTRQTGFLSFFFWIHLGGIRSIRDLRLSEEGDSGISLT